MKAAPILVFGSLLLTQTFGQVAPTEANLRAAAASGGVTKFSGDGTISLTTPVAINTDTTIDADGHAVVIDGANVTTLFQVAATGKLTLKGLSLVNGRAKGANAIFGGEPAGSAAGGAIQNSGGQVMAVSCTFSNNAAIAGNGAAPSPTSPYWQYTSGGAASGGAIFQSSGSLTIQGGAFLANSAAAGYGSGPAPAYGGAISSLDGNVAITDTTFATNTLTAGGNNGLHGNAEAHGGAVYIEKGSLTAQRVRFLGNFANGLANAASYGGAVASKEGTLTISDSLFSGNTALGGAGSYYTTGITVAGLPGSGGGLNVGSNATATVHSSTFVDNISKGGRDSSILNEGRYGQSYGGAVAVQGNAAIVNSTFVGNSAYLYPPTHFGTSQVADGGVIYSAGASALTNVTIAGNSTGLAILSAAASGSLQIRNSLLAENPGVNVAAAITDAGNNLSATASPTFSQSTSHNSADLRLGPLGDYGGPTPTVVLLGGSAAIDAADDSAAPATDQRGRARPFGDHADVGAFESSPPYHIFGTLHGYLNSSTTVASGGTSVAPAANGTFAFTVPAGENSFAFSGTNSVFRPNPLNITAGSDTQIEARAFAFGALAFDPDLASPAFTLAGRSGEAWDIYTSDDLQNWSLAVSKLFSADNIASVLLENSTAQTFVKAVRTDRQLP
jgi:fibronectin-binding autotransporter adhesin